MLTAMEFWVPHIPLCNFYHAMMSQISSVLTTSCWTLHLSTWGETGIVSLSTPWHLILEHLFFAVDFLFIFHPLSPPSLFFFFTVSPESTVAIFYPWVNGENHEEFGIGWSKRRGITGITLLSLSTNSPKSCYCNIKHSWNIKHWSLWVFSSINISL